jgi:hypothetical protein
MSVPRLSSKRQAARRYQTDRPIRVTILKTISSGILPAGALIRDERRNLGDYKVTFQASTDKGKTWEYVGTNDNYVSFKAPRKL